MFGILGGCCLESLGDDIWDPGGWCLGSRRMLFGIDLVTRLGPKIENCMTMVQV